MENKMKKYNYTIDVNVSGNVSAETVEQIVKDIIENETGRKIKSLTMRVRSKTDGQIITQVFDGATINFENDEKILDKTLKKSVPFTPSTY
jgi:hypothetical protein